MVKLRLARIGAKKKPFHRLVATDSRKPRDGRFIEILGTCNPSVTPKVSGLNEERVFYWLDQGAQMSATVHTLLKGHGTLTRWQTRGESPVSEQDVPLLDQEQEELAATTEEEIEEPEEDAGEPEPLEA